LSSGAKPYPAAGAGPDTTAWGRRRGPPTSCNPQSGQCVAVAGSPLRDLHAWWTGFPQPLQNDPREVVGDDLPHTARIVARRVVTWRSILVVNSAFFACHSALRNATSARVSSGDRSSGAHQRVEVGVCAAALVVELDHVVQRLQAAVVHVRGGQRRAAQRRRLEPTAVGVGLGDGVGAPGRPRPQLTPVL